MQINLGNLSNVAFCALREIFPRSRGVGAWPKWPNGKYASGCHSSYQQRHASEERCFSALRWLKTHTRPILNHLLFLHCHKDRVGQLDLRPVAQEFVSADDKRSQFFGNFFYAKYFET